MSDQGQNEKAQILDSENVPSESSINAEFKESDYSEEEKERLKMRLGRNQEKSTGNQSRDYLKMPKDDTGVNLEPSVEQQNAVVVVEEKEQSAALESSKQSAMAAMSMLPEEAVKSALSEQSALAEEAKWSALAEKCVLLEEAEKSALTERSALPEEAKRSALPEGAKQSALAEKSAFHEEEEEKSALTEWSALLEEAKRSALPEEEVEKSALTKPSALPEGAKQSALAEKSAFLEEEEKSALTEQSALPEEAMQRSSAEKSALPEEAKKALMEQCALLEETKQSVLPEEIENSALTEKSTLPEKVKESALAEKSALTEQSGLPREVEKSTLTKKSALPKEMKKSALTEKSELTEQSVLPEEVEQSALTKNCTLVEKLWTRGGAVVIVLIAIVFYTCANPFCGTQILDSRSALQIFQDEFKRLQKDFPEQNHNLWLRSGKMLTNHLNKSNPDEPAMIILTAAQDAKHTLLCLGSGLAQTYAVALNSSWLLIHGPSQAQYDASTAKLHIDEQLSSGFESEHRAAVLNRLETLPPGSLLILYKYCDHENAAYKNVALVFTVLLEDSSLEPDTPLPELEEKVRDFLWQQFIRSGTIRSHQEMDSDKLSGVWSRISHLVLPVLPVQTIEAGKCPFVRE